jgi:hypothetical protein
VAVFTALPMIHLARAHRYWREARQLAGEQVQRLRDELRNSLATASALLKQMPHDSEPWHELAARLKATRLYLSSATHCLYEWPEPVDAVADMAPEIAVGLDEKPSKILRVANL